MQGTVSLEAVGVRMFVDILKRQKRVVYISVAAFTVLGLCLNIFIPPAYRATVRMEILPPADRSPLTGEVLGSGSYQSENLSMLTAAEQITSRRLLGRVASEFSPRGWIRTLSRSSGQSDFAGLISLLRKPIAKASGRSAPATEGAEPVDRMTLNGQVDWLRTIVKVEPVPDTRLVDLKVEHRVPEAAVTIADELSQLFVADQWRRAADTDTSSLAYLRSQLDQMRRRIEGSGYQMGGVGLGSPATVQGRIRQLNDAIVGLSAQHLKASDEYVAVKARLDRLATVGAGGADDSGLLLVGDIGLEALQRDLQNCRSQLVAARGVYQEKHPKLMMLESQYEALLTSLRREQGRAIAGLRADASVLAERVRSLKANLDQSRQELSAIEDQSQRYAAGESDFKTDQDLYALLLAKVQQGRMEGLMKSSPVEIVDAATLDPKPIRPRKALNLIVCLVTGLLAGAGLALFRDSMRRTIRGPEEVEPHLALPLLAVIPKNG
jgi:succinoglycan biosynthesis transport protein ExoP